MVQLGRQRPLRCKRAVRGPVPIGTEPALSWTTEVCGSLPLEAVADGRDGVAWYSRTRTVPGLSWRRGKRSCRARLSKNLRLSRSRPPKARSCRRAAIMRPSRSLLKPAGGTRPKTSRHCRRSASSRSKRMRSISAAIAAGSCQRRRTIRRPAELRRSQTRGLLACRRQRSGRHARRRSSRRKG
jgi:hypothetical protein